MSTPLVVAGCYLVQMTSLPYKMGRAELTFTFRSSDSFFAHLLVPPGPLFFSPPFFFFWGGGGGRFVVAVLCFLAAEYLLLLGGRV